MGPSHRGHRGPLKGMGLPPGPEVSGYVLKGQQLCPQRSADILGVIVYVFKGQWLCSKVSLMPVKVSGSVATLGPHWRRQGLALRPRDLPPAEVICPAGTRCLPPCGGHSRGLPQGLALWTEPQPSTQALGTRLGFTWGPDLWADWRWDVQPLVWPREGLAWPRWGRVGSGGPSVRSCPRVGLREGAMSSGWRGPRCLLLVLR